MKHNRRSRGGLWLVCLVFLVSLQGYAQLVTNGSFENTATGTYTERGIQGWLLSVSGGGSATFSVVDDTVQKGNRALKVEVATKGTNAWDIQAVADSIPVVPGETYVYTVWAKSRISGAKVNFTVGRYNYNEYGRIHEVTLTTQWQKFTLQFTISDQETYIRAPIHFSFTENAGNAIFIDNLRIVSANAANRPVLVEAESGVVGSNFVVNTEESTTYITIQPSGGGESPADTARVATYTVTFPDSGTYNLYARVKVGSGTYNDDSFFYGNGFGVQDVALNDAWIKVNGLAAAGYADSADIVNDIGGLGSGVWKWVKLSQIENGTQGWELGPQFVVSEDSLTQVFQIGGREDGLYIDKFAFGRAELYYTVSNLDQGTEGSTQLPGTIWTGPPLAHKQPKFVGNIYSPSQVSNFVAYWNQVTPENEGKWGTVEGTRDVMNWSGLDAAYHLAKDNGFPFMFHVLLWGAQQPSWISSLDSAEQIQEIEEWFQAVADRYPDIEYLQVVNEPLHAPPDGGGSTPRANYIAALGGNGATGWDWILNAYRMARRIFPATTKLVINDYNIINSSTSTSNYLKIIRLLQSENLIDVIGEQGHAFTTFGIPVTLLKRNLDSLAATGLPLQITEMDIDGSTDNAQLDEYKRVFPALYNHPAVEGITLWGWKPGLWRETAYLITQGGTERPALQWLRTYLDTVQIVTSITQKAGVPQQFVLFQNFPNPFNPTTKIVYTLPHESYISLKIYNALGQEVATLIEGQQAGGSYEITLNASKFTSGVYFYQLRAGRFVDTKKFVLLK